MTDQIEGVGAVMALCARFKFSKALRKCEALLARNPGEATLMQLKGDILIGLHRYAEARQLFESLPRRDAEALASIGATHFFENECEHAIEHCREALALNKQCLKAWSYLIDSLSSAGRKDEAAKELEYAFAAFAAEKRYERALLLYMRAKMEAERQCRAKARRTVLEAISENRHELFLSFLQTLNPPATEASRWWLLAVSGDGSAFARHGGSSGYYGAFEVIADSRDEALKYIAEVEPRVSRDSFRVDESTKRKLKGVSRNKGVIAVHFSFSHESTELGKVELAGGCGPSTNVLH